MSVSDERRLHELLCAYLLDELDDAGDRARVEEALRSRPELAEERERLAGTIGLVQTSLESCGDADRLSAPARERLLAAARERQAQAGPWAARRWRNGLAAAAAALLVGWVGYRLTGDEPGGGAVHEDVARSDARDAGGAAEAGESGGRFFDDGRGADFKRAELQEQPPAPAALSKSAEPGEPPGDSGGVGDSGGAGGAGGAVVGAELDDVLKDGSVRSLAVAEREQGRDGKFQDAAAAGDDDDADAEGFTEELAAPAPAQRPVAEARREAPPAVEPVSTGSAQPRPSTAAAGPGPGGAPAGPADSKNSGAPGPAGTAGAPGAPAERGRGAEAGRRVKVAREGEKRDEAVAELRRLNEQLAALPADAADVPATVEALEQQLDPSMGFPQVAPLDFSDLESFTTVLAGTDPPLALSLDALTRGYAGGEPSAGFFYVQDFDVELGDTGLVAGVPLWSGVEGNGAPIDFYTWRDFSVEVAQGAAVAEPIAGVTGEQEPAAGLTPHGLPEWAVPAREALVAELQANVAPESWNAPGAALTWDIRGRLLVENSPEVREEVRLYLEERREEAELARKRALIDDLIARCRPLPGETPSMMFFRYWGDNAFESALIDNQSTFATDVDTASYTLARNYLAKGHVPPREQVRTEEFVNFFRADVPPPVESTFGIHMELAPSPFGEAGKEHWMLRVVVRGKDVERTERAPLSLTFVIDTSGSMKEENRLELVKHALRLLLAELDERDTIALVAFSSEARLVLPATTAGSRGLIESAIHGLHADGSTNAEAGLLMGYEQAALMLSEGATNRVVLLSDGVANVGQTDQDRITADVEEHRERGIYLNTIGVGMGNHNDVFLEQLANKGDGMCAYVDTPAQARRHLVEDFTSTFEPIARDVKVQLEFDPYQVESYRLLGYENRAIADEDFRNDAVDAGEVGAGHQVTALYELVRHGGGPDPEQPLATARLRWKAPHEVGAEGADEVMETSASLGAREASGTFEGTTAGFRRAVLVAQFAEFLRRSVHARGDSLDELIERSRKLEAELEDADFTEFTELLERSRALILAQLPEQDALAQAIDAVRYQKYLQAQIEDLRRREGERMLEGLEQRNQELEEELRKLLEKHLQVQPREEER